MTINTFLILIIIILGCGNIINFCLVQMLKHCYDVLKQLLDKTAYNRQVVDSNEKALNLLLADHINKSTKGANKK